VEEAFKTILDNVQEGNIPIEEKIENIEQYMKAYISHITRLMDLLAPHQKLKHKGSKRLQVIWRVLH